MAVLASLFILPPFFYWLTVTSRFTNSSDFLFRIWNYLPAKTFDAIILFLPIPSFFLSVYTLWKIQKHKARGILLCLITLCLSIAFLIFCILTVIKPG